MAECIDSPAGLEPDAREASASAGDAHLPLSLIVRYGLPVAPLSFMGALASLYLLKFTADVLLIAPAAFATVFAISKVWDAVSDPIVGYWSDRTRHWAGRRRPWIVAAAIPMSLAFWAVWNPPELSDPALKLWVGVAIVLYYTAYTLAAVPHLALGAELTTDHHERTRVFGGRGLFDVVGVMAAAGAVAWLQTSDDPRAVGQWIALLFAPFTVVLLWLGVSGLRERPEYRGRGARAPLSALADVARNAHARILLSVVVLETLSFSLLGAMFPFATEYLFPGEGAVSGSYVVAALAVAVLLFPAWFPLARRFGKRAAWLCALVMKCTGFGVLLLAGASAAWVFPVSIVLIGGALGCSMILPASVKSDVIDYDELVTGERKEGSYFAVWNFCQKLASGAAIGISGVALQLAGYEANVAQDESAATAIRLLFSGVPFVLHLVAIALLLRFRLGEAEHRRIRAELDRRAQ